jgi:hypothetical protein
MFWCTGRFSRCDRSRRPGPSSLYLSAPLRAIWVPGALHKTPCYSGDGGGVHATVNRFDCLWDTAYDNEQAAGLVLHIRGGRPRGRGKEAPRFPKPIIKGYEINKERSGSSIEKSTRR